MRKIVIFIVMILLLIACYGIAPQTAEEERGWYCDPLSESFQVSDLVGTWRAISEAAVSSDIIILRGDGTYKQTYQKSNGYRYESPWNRWWVEHRPSGGMYVHLEKMRYCDSTDNECARLEGGGGEWLFYDYCERRALRMKGEVILAVISTEETRNPFLRSAPRGIALLHMASDPDSRPSHFILAED